MRGGDRAAGLQQKSLANLLQQGLIDLFAARFFRRGKCFYESAGEDGFGLKLIAGHIEC